MSNFIYNSFRERLMDSNFFRSSLYWQAQREMQEFNPRASMHGYKMSAEGIGMFCDWLLERQLDELVDFIRENQMAFEEDLFLTRLAGSQFLHAKRITEYTFAYVQPLLFGGGQILVGPYADATIGGDDWYQYWTLEQAVYALEKWSGQGMPPEDGLIKWQIGNGDIQRVEIQMANDGE